ncbi:Gfo/Idh/MocA family oxidoreductase [soil metagenome]
MSDQKLAIGVVGAGYWGPNLLRNFAACPATRVAAICDANATRLQSVARNYSDSIAVTSLDRLLELKLDAVAIATPASTHFEMARRALEAGLHVMIEKPLAASVNEARALVELAARHDRRLMVDHTYLFHPAVRKIHEIIRRGDLGDLYCIDSIRINLGLFQHDVNVVWDLAPHDLSIIQHVIGRDPQSIGASGCAHADPEIEDVAYVNIDYGQGMCASVHVNWLSPVKVRQMMFVGSKKSLIFNELNASEPVKVYDRGVSFDSNDETERRMRVSYRSGDVWSPQIEPGEALQNAVGHFAQCVRTGETPISDGQLGLRVVELLEAANRSIRSQGRRVILQDEPAAPTVATQSC